MPYYELTDKDIVEVASTVRPVELLLYGLLFLILLEHLFEFYLSTRQIDVYTNALAIPAEIERVTNPVFYHIARIWGMDREYYVVFKTLIFTVFIGCIELIYGLVPFFWNVSVYLAKSWQWDYTNEMIVGYMFAAILLLYVTLRRLPLKLVQTYIIQRRYTQQIPSPAYFAAVQILHLIVNLVVVAPLVAFIVFVVQFGGEFFYLYLWLASLLVMIIILIFYPLVIAPCFDKYVHFEEGSTIKNEIERLAKTVGFPVKRIYIVQNNKQSEHSNAYFYGVCCVKRIIIHESLLPPDARPKRTQPPEVMNSEAQMLLNQIIYTNSEVLAIVAHELGHWKKNHVIYGLILMQMGMLITYTVFGFAFKWHLLYEAVGFEQGVCPIIGGFIICIVYVLSPVGAMFTLISRCVMRRFEYQADQFAAKLGYSDALRNGLIKIYQLNFSFPVYDGWYAWYHHTHPTLLQRLKKIQNT